MGVNSLETSSCELIVTKLIAIIQKECMSTCCVLNISMQCCKYFPNMKYLERLLKKKQSIIEFLNLKLHRISLLNFYRPDIVVVEFYYMRFVKHLYCDASVLM